MRLRVLLPALLPALVLAACEKAPPPRAVQPTFYQDLSGAGSQVDQVKALAMINEYRAKSGAGPLKLDPELGRIAREYAATMAAADKMSHQVTASDKLGDRLRAQGYEFAAAGENIAAGYRTLAEAFSGWRQSPARPRHEGSGHDPDGDRNGGEPEFQVQGVLVVDLRPSEGCRGHAGGHRGALRAHGARRPSPRVERAVLFAFRSS